MTKKVAIDTTFRSITAYQKFLQETPRAAGAGEVSEVIRDDRWDGGLHFDQAMTMAASGGYWPEGAAKLMDAHAQTEKAIKQWADAPDYDVTGAYLDVAEYCAGEPEHWIQPPSEAEQPIIRIGVSTGRSASVSAEACMNRGAAVLSAINALELDGFRCELWAVDCDGCHNGLHINRTLIKAADAGWSPHSVAFAIAHPAYSRRLNFRKMECHSVLNRETNGGYGTPSNDCSGDYDLWLPCMYGDSGYCSAHEAMQTLVQLMNQAGLALTVGVAA